MNRYSKWIVILVILLNVGFLFYLRDMMFVLGFEPETLIKSWFTFTGVELLALATITIAKVKQKGGQE